MHGLWPQWNIVQAEKALWLQWNIPSRFIALMEKAWFYERLFYEVVSVHTVLKMQCQSKLVLCIT